MSLKVSNQIERLNIVQRPLADLSAVALGSDLLSLR